MLPLPAVSAPGFYVLSLNVDAIDHGLSVISPKLPTLFEAEQFMLTVSYAPPMQVMASDGTRWIPFIDHLENVLDVPTLTALQVEELSLGEIEIWVSSIPVPYLRLQGFYDFHLVTQNQFGVVCIDCKKRLTFGDSACFGEYNFSFIIG